MSREAKGRDKNTGLEAQVVALPAREATVNERMKIHFSRDRVQPEKPMVKLPGPGLTGLEVKSCRIKGCQEAHLGNGLKYLNGNLAVIPKS